MNLESFTRLLQMTISPMVLISGVGLLLLSATNRLGRSIDRSRILHRELRQAGDRAEVQDRTQLDVLWRRCHILQWSIGLLAFSILCSVLMILLLIATAFSRIDLHVPILAILTVDVLSIVAAVVFFLLDIALALQALRIELRRA
ncbi:MAG TPA: DUF2721 domain-containing protein [Thermoanaerobaculia bacterium]|nr:DUF2721 domain-containing protein [Thermoanaerobaculia bacterium]